MFKFLSALTLTLCVLSLTSCQKDEIVPQEESMDFSQGMFVLNQGGIGGQEASLTFIVSGSEIYRHAYEKVNDQPLMGSGRALVAYGDDYFVALEEPTRVERLNQDLQHTGELSGLSGARDVCFWSADKAYVSGATDITIFDPASMTPTGSIAVSAGVTKMVTNGWKVYAMQPDAQKVLVIDPATEMVEHELSVGENPVSMIFDPQGRLLVLCQEDGVTQEPTIRMFTLSNNMQVKYYAFGQPGTRVENLHLDPVTGKVYMVYNNSIRRVSSDLNSIVRCTASGGAQGLYYPAIHPTSGHLYAIDQGRDGERGSLIKFDVEDGSTINEYPLDFYPVSMIFVNP